MFPKITGIVLATMATLLCGCSNWTGGRPADQYVPVPGQYAPPAQNAAKLRVAIPLVAVEKPAGLAPDVDVQAASSDELFSLLDSSGRCDLTERLRLKSILAAQGLSGMVEPGQLVHPGPVQGFDYVLLGRISNLSIDREQPPSQISVEGVENTLHLGSGWTPKLITHGKVDLMLVDAHTGSVAVLGSGDFTHTAAPQDLGLQLTSEQLKTASKVQLNPTDTRRILRFALDETLRPMLPRIDRWAAAMLPSHDSSSAPAVAATAPSTQPSRPAPQILLSTQICPECGARVRADQEFCPVCGHKLH